MAKKQINNETVRRTITLEKNLNKQIDLLFRMTNKSLSDVVSKHLTRSLNDYKAKGGFSSDDELTIDAIAKCERAIATRVQSDTATPTQKEQGGTATVSGASDGGRVVAGSQMPAVARPAMPGATGSQGNTSQVKS